MAERRAGSMWSEPLAHVVVDAELAHALHAAWLRDAEMEHASVAAFSQLALALMAHGAPPDLIAACHEAALDEIAHARACYALASRYGAAMEPGPLAVPTHVPDVDALVTETFRDGCIGETAAAWVARQAAEQCRDGEVRRVLTMIADDEERHAALAWRILRWALVLPGAREALVREIDRLPHGAASEPPAAALAMHGVLDEAHEAFLNSEVVRGVVRPCAASLLAAS